MQGSQKNIQNLKQLFVNILKQQNYDVVVYQMGKVGSSSILGSIKNCYQVHAWEGDLPIKYFSSKFYGSLQGYIFTYLKWKLKHYMAVKNLNKRISESKKTKFVIGVREPVSRNVSAFFQALPPNYQVELETLRTEFLCYASHYSSQFWFDNELKKYFGIDIYQYEFDKTQGYTVFVKDNFEFFIYQLEKLNKVKDNLFEFLDIDADLSKENLAINKPNKERYKLFLDSVFINESYIDSMYDNKYCRHFYDTEDLSKFKSKWLRIELNDARKS